MIERHLDAVAILEEVAGRPRRTVRLLGTALFQNPGCRCRRGSEAGSRPDR